MSTIPDFSMLDIGDNVKITPNTNSLYEQDHNEPIWYGKIIGIHKYSASVQPNDKNLLPRDILYYRISKI